MMMRKPVVLAIIAWIVLWGQETNLLGDSYTELNNEGVKAYERGDFYLALKKFEEALSLNPDDSTIRGNLRDAYIGYAIEESKRGNFSNAVRYSNRALEIDGRISTRRQTASVYANYAVTLARKEKWKEALEPALKAIELSPGNETFKKNYVNIGLRYAGKLSGRRKEILLLDLLKVDPNSVNTLILLGEFYYGSEDLEEAVKYWEKALENNPGSKTIQRKLEKAKKEMESEGDYKKTKRTRFTIKYQGYEKSSLAWQSLDTLDRAFYLLRSRLGFYSKRRISVIIYTGGDFRKVVGLPDWAAGAYDGKIRLREGDIESPRAEDIIYHEYVHALLHEWVGNNIPIWFNEGLAQYFEPGQKWDKPRKQSLAGKIGTADWLSYEQLARPFTEIKDSVRVRVAYEESLSLVHFIVQNYGEYSLVRILNAVRSGNDFDTALWKSIYLDKQSLEQNWIFYLKN